MIKSEIMAYIMYLALKERSFTSAEVCSVYGIEKNTKNFYRALSSIKNTLQDRKLYHIEILYSHF